MPLPLVLAISQVAGMVVLLVALVAHHQPLRPDARLWACVGAGIASLAALGLLYQAMARGSIAIVAPVAASGAVLPVLIGFVRGDPIGALAAIGIVLALGGAVTAAWEPGAAPGEAATGAPADAIATAAGSTMAAGSATGAGSATAEGRATGAGRAGRERLVGALLALGSAIGIGLFFTLIEVGSRDDPYWATVLARGTACVTILGYLAVRRRPAAGPANLSVATVIGVAAIGLTDALAEILFATASTVGELGIVAVLSSVYPVITVALALLVLRERMRWPQACAAASALLGVLLLGYVTGA